MYDFLPEALLPRVVNLEDFRAILVFDKWTNADDRQCVFYRALVRQGGVVEGRPGFVARMIDHGYTFKWAELGLSGIRGTGLVCEGVEAHPSRLDHRRGGRAGAAAGRLGPAACTITGAD